MHQLAPNQHQSQKDTTKDTVKSPEEMFAWNRSPQQGASQKTTGSFQQVLVTLSLVFSFAGYFPLYTWHILITVSLFLIALFIVLRKDSTTEIFKPRHVKEIAEVLNKWDDDNNKMTDNNNPASPVYIYQTRKGLRISKGQLESNDSIITHYTVSFSNKDALNYRDVEELAVLIKQLRKHSGMFQIIEKQEGIFHISFSLLKRPGTTDIIEQSRYEEYELP